MREVSNCWSAALVRFKPKDARRWSEIAFKLTRLFPPVSHAPQSLGVVNGLAQSLPKPNYPAAALAVNIQGKVDVQVLIDESGRVVSAKAISGNGMLRQAAEQAARNARFSPTTLSRVPVKVTGVIVYNFTKS